MAIPDTFGGALRRLAPGLALYAALALSYLAYAPGLAGPFVLDDLQNVVTPLTELANGRTSAHDVALGNESGPFGRPLAAGTFVLEWLGGADTASAFKRTNLLLHLLCGVLAAWLSVRLFRRHAGDGTAGWWLGVAVAALWLSAPLLASTVLYVVQRMTQLSALFSLAGLVAYVVGREQLEAGLRRGLPLVLSTFVLFLPLAALSKESGLLLPLLAFLVEAFFYRFRGPAWARYFIGSVFAVFLALPLVVGALAVALRPEVITAGYGDRPFTVAERLLTQSRVLFSYLGQLVLPRGADTGLFHDDYPLSRGLLDPPTTALAILAWGALLAWLWRARGTLGLAAFGLAFFVAGHALESSVIPLETYFEHRNYLPAVGVFVAVAAVGLRAMQALPRIRPAVVALLVGVPLAYAAATHARALVWSDLTTLLRVTYLAHPDSPRLNAFLAEHYAAQGALPEALGHLERLVALDPDAAAGAAVSRLYVHCRSGRVPDGDAYAELERQLGFRRQAYLINTVKVLTEDLWTGRCPEVDAGRLADILQRWVDADTGTSAEMRWVVRVHLARVQLALRRDAAALANLDAASRLLPRRLEPGILRLRYQVDKGDAAGARKTLEGLRRIDDGGSTHLTRALQLFEGLLAEMEARRPDV